MEPEIRQHCPLIKKWPLYLLCSEWFSMLLPFQSISMPLLQYVVFCLDIYYVVVAYLLLSCRVASACLAVRLSSSPDCCAQTCPINVRLNCLRPVYTVHNMQWQHISKIYDYPARLSCCVFFEMLQQFIMLVSWRGSPSQTTVGAHAPTQRLDDPSHSHGLSSNPTFWWCPRPKPPSQLILIVHQNTNLSL